MTTELSAAPEAEQQKAKAGPRPTARKGGKTTKESILAAAEAVFAKSGYHGASTGGIAKQAKCYESLIYYHYGNKDKLFAAVLENAYRKLVKAEQALVVDYGDPQRALADVVLFMWRYYQDHPEMIFLLNTENSLKGKHVKRSAALEQFLPNAIKVLRNVVEAGIQRDVFRENIDVDDLYITVMGLGYFYLSNRYTLSAFFGKDLMAERERERWERTIVETVFNAVRKVQP
ncbi:TetR family transcriptional regulator [Variovorax paradoxus]|nr:TetR family transcriptional regulator [Variovorax paradoxus]